MESSKIQTVTLNALLGQGPGTRDDMIRTWIDFIDEGKILEVIHGDFYKFDDKTSLLVFLKNNNVNISSF